MGNHAMELRNHVDECEVCGPASEEGKTGGTFAEILALCCDEGAKLRHRYYQDWVYAKEPDKPFQCGCRCDCEAPIKQKIGWETVPVWCSPCEERAEAGEMPHSQCYVTKKFVFPVIRNKDGTPKTFPKLMSDEITSTPDDTKALFNDVALHMATVVSTMSLGDDFAEVSVEEQIETIEGILEASVGSGKESLCAEIVLTRLRALGLSEEVIKRAQSFMDKGKEE